MTISSAEAGPVVVLRRRSVVLLVSEWIILGGKTKKSEGQGQEDSMRKKYLQQVWSYRCLYGLLGFRRERGCHRLLIIRTLSSVKMGEPFFRSKEERQTGY